MSILNNSFHTKQNPVFTGLKFGFGSTSDTTEVLPTPYWIATLGGTSNDYGEGIALDDSGNVYVCGENNQSALVSKYNNSGVLQWQRKLDFTGVNDYAYGITADNDNVYVVGTTRRNSDGRGFKNKIHVSSINSAGVYQWSKIYDYDTNQGGLSEYFVNSEGKAIVEDSYYLYVTGRLDTLTSAANQYILVMRINKSNGSVLWFNTLGKEALYEESIGRAIEIKNSNLYISGDYTTGEEGYVAKLSPTDGSFIWHRRIISTSANDDAEAHGVAVDSSDNVFVSGQNGDDDYLFVIKYNYAGVKQWSRKIYDSSATFMSAREIAVDSLDNIYIVGHSVISGSTDILIVKLNNSDGTIQWQRTLGGSGTNIGKGIKIDSSDNLYIVGYTSSDGAGGSDLLIARLPSDGTLEDTYGNFTYQQSSFLESATTFDASPNNFVEDPGDISGDSLDVSNSNFTITIPSLTSETTKLD